jgi:hypothetical protein
MSAAPSLRPATADEIAETLSFAPLLWFRLPVETQRQLAQQIARLVQRVRLTPPQAMEGNRAEHGNID